MNKKLSFIVLITILLVASFFRLWQLNYDVTRTQGQWPSPASIPPGLYPDEAMAGNEGSEALHTGNFRVFYPYNNGEEGLFANLVGLSVYFFGNTSFALRVVDAIFGILTVLALYLFAREYTSNEYIALLGAFFIGSGFWHVMFSRIGFRATMAPFFLTAALWALYYIYNRIESASHTRLVITSVIGGIFFGLGFYSYIAYRVAPLLLIPVFILLYKKAKTTKDSCILCLPALFLFITFVVALPIGIYFLNHPGDFFGRTSQISIFSNPHPGKLFLENVGKTIQMFYFVGDLNWRHNFAGNPALWWPVAMFFTIGFFEAIRKRYWLLPLWFFAMLLPVAISSEGLPHSLRAIIMAPVVYLYAAIGFHLVIKSIIEWFQRQEKAHSDLVILLKTIQFSFVALAIVVLIGIAANSFTWYFFRWGHRPEVAQAYGGDLYNIGLFLNAARADVPKYVITSETDTIDVTGRPMSLEPILFASDTYPPRDAAAKNIFYITLKQINTIQCNAGCIVIPIDNLQPTLSAVEKNIPKLKLDPEIKDKYGVLAATPQ